MPVVSDSDCRWEGNLEIACENVDGIGVVFVHFNLWGSLGVAFCFGGFAVKVELRMFDAGGECT